MEPSWLPAECVLVLHHLSDQYVQALFCVCEKVAQVSSDFASVCAHTSQRLSIKVLSDPI